LEIKCIMKQGSTSYIFNNSIRIILRFSVSKYPRIFCCLDSDEECDWSLVVLLVQGRVGDTDQHHVVVAESLHRSRGGHQDVEEDVPEAGSCSDDQLKLLILGVFQMDVPETSLNVGITFLVE